MIELIQQQDIRKRKQGSHSFSLPAVSADRAATAGLHALGTLVKAPEKLAGLAMIIGLSLLIAAGVYSLFPRFSGMYDEPLLLPADKQIQASLISFLEGSAAVDHVSVEGEMPPVASFLGGVAEKVHTVKPGDTLSEIAAAYDVEIGTLINYNGVQDVRRINTGTVLKIPSFDGIRYEVRPGDNLSGIALANNVTVNAILDANSLESALIQPGDVLFLPGAAISDYEYKKATGTLIIYPTRGRLTSGFGYRSDPFTGVRRFHYGIDLANSLGTPIMAAMDGVVVDVENRPAGYGKYIVIRHSRGYQTLYGHLSSINVREGQRVKQGQRIGLMGSTGRSTGPHLHFSIYQNNRPVDPLAILH